MKKLMLAVLLFLPVGVKAQATPGTNPCALPATFSAWLTCQQGQVGLAYQIVNAKLNQTYESQWWDAVSFGQAGINVGLATAHDYVDLGPAINVGNGLVTRYGFAIPLHVGNIWNDSSGHLPAKIASHIWLATIPNVTIAPQFFWPQNGQISKATWLKDFMISVAYRFGGS